MSNEIEIEMTFLNTKQHIFTCIHKHIQLTFYFRLPPNFSEYVETDDPDIFILSEVEKLNVSVHLHMYIYFNLHYVYKYIVKFTHNVYNYTL
jgi:hypothetical protein